MMRGFERRQYSRKSTSQTNETMAIVSSDDTVTEVENESRLKSMSMRMTMPIITKVAAQNADAYPTSLAEKSPKDTNLRRCRVTARNAVCSTMAISEAMANPQTPNRSYKAE